MAGIPFWVILMMLGCWCGRRRCRCSCACDDGSCTCRCGCGRGVRCRTGIPMGALIVVWIVLTMLSGGSGTPTVVLLACVAIGYFLRKMEELRQDEVMDGVPTEEMENAAKEE